MKGLLWTIVVMGIMVSISSNAFRADDPATPYDESEGAFSFVAPVSVCKIIVPRLTVLVGGPVTILRVQRAASTDDAMAYAITMMRPLASQFRLQLLSKPLLC